MFYTSLSLKSFFLLLVCQVYNVEGSEVARLIVPEAGENLEAPPRSSLPEFDIKKENTYSDPQGTIIFNSVNPPDLSNYFKPRPVSREAPHAPQLEEHEDAELATITMVVNATIYDDKTSLIKWQDVKDGVSVEFSAWSNIDWSLFVGFNEFEARGFKFTYLMVHSHAAQDSIIPKELPLLSNGGARYMLIQGDESVDTSMEFMEGIHELYEAESEYLIAAHKKREVERLQKAEELRQNPTQSKDIIINSWAGKNSSPKIR